ncbi:hypothetical protein BOTCAL_0375g00130 [Botryotinia calthae]|uniref:Uncharacterized protein n=1 Tax=Botryotinia calthae TaxID=38488 RepID=A0A4Y8CRS3_9HELO|nr:hypothetical protein BOTCAL_0375g00130 [Botryotinia calthae]
MIRISGTDYIQSLCTEPTTIPITGSEIACCYKLAIGTHGICAIKIISEDGSFYWAGKVPTSGLVWEITELTGVYSGVALHLPLQSSERISYAWIKLEESKIRRNYDPAFIIQTTHGRTCHLGPCVPHDEYKSYQWYRLTFHGQITGSCVQNCDWKLENFNIISDGIEVELAQPLLHYETLKQRPHIYLSQNSKYGDYDFYLSSTKFSQMKRATLCEINERCMGILIDYLYEPPVVLGQWYKTEVSSHQITYDRSHPQSSKVIFQLARFENSEVSFVVDVSFTQEELPLNIDDNNQVQVFDLALEEHIAWWFTSSTDFISLWNPGDQSAHGVEMREIICQDHEF